MRFSCCSTVWRNRPFTVRAADLECVLLSLADDLLRFVRMTDVELAAVITLVGDDQFASHAAYFLRS